MPLSSGGALKRAFYSEQAYLLRVIGSEKSIPPETTVVNSGQADLVYLLRVVKLVGPEKSLFSLSLLYLC